MMNEIWLYKFGYKKNYILNIYIYIFNICINIYIEYKE